MSRSASNGNSPLDLLSGQLALRLDGCVVDARCMRQPPDRGRFFPYQLKQKLADWKE